MVGRAVVTGHSGALGRHLCRRLAEAGMDVTGVSHVPGGVVAREVVGDLGTVSWKDLVDEGTVVFHLAAMVHVRSSTPEDAREFDRVNHQATAGLARACGEAHAALVFASTVAVLGAAGSGPPPSDSTAVPHPATDYGRSKWLAERAIQGLWRPGLHWVTLRFPLLYGPCGRGNMERMLGAIARGRYWPIRSDARKSCLYFEDAARALVLASLSKEARGGTFLVAPPRSITVSELQQAAYRAVGRRMPPELPLRPVLWTSTLAQRGAEALFGHSMGLVSSIQTLVGPAAYDGSRFARWTGFVPDVPLLEGLRRTADSLQSRP